jgi:hypothetical protein
MNRSAVSLSILAAALTDPVNETRNLRLDWQVRQRAEGFGSDPSRIVAPALQAAAQLVIYFTAKHLVSHVHCPQSAWFCSFGMERSAFVSLSAILPGRRPPGL